MCFDPGSGEWNVLKPTAKNRLSGASFVMNGCLNSAGGMKGEGERSVERHNVNSASWEEVAPMHEGRQQVVAVTIGSTGLPVEQDLFDSLIAKAARRLN
jgi:hypothetical protein